MENVFEIKPLGFHWEMYDPFIFCAHHNDKFPQGNKELGPDTELLKGRNIGSDFVVKDGFRMYHGDKVPGFPVHPHRGFETVTITLKGLVDHSDSFGAAGRYGNGDVQWMTAGKGIQHSEMFPLVNQEHDNTLELLQVWINLPAENKFAEPFYKMLWSEDMPVIEEKSKTGLNRIFVIAGNFRDIKPLDPAPKSWAADPNNEVGIWIIELPSNGKIKLPAASSNVNRTLYHYYGNGIKVADANIPEYHQARLAANEELVIENGSQPGTILILQGIPIREPVVQYGPFVMNTRIEIQQAYQDYAETRFGGWPWDRNDPVHGNEPVRFAKYIDGTRETRDSR